MQQQLKKVNEKIRIKTRKKTRDGQQIITTQMVTSEVADACRLLSHRGCHGVHIDRLGGHDMLAELARQQLPVEVGFSLGRGTGYDLVWVFALFAVVEIGASDALEVA